MVRILSVLFLLSSILILTLFGLADDLLFFHSDPASILIFTSAVAAGLTMLVCAVTLPFLKAGSRTSLHRSVSLACATLLLSDCVFFSIDALDRQFRILQFLREIRMEYLVFAIWALLVLVIGVRIFRNPRRDHYADRVSRVATIVAPACLVMLVLHLGYHYLERAKKGEASKRIVMIVLDSWPAEYIHSFNADTPVKPIDSVFKNAQILHQMRTSTPWTHGYFGTLYTGTPKINFSKKPATLSQWIGILSHPGWNLFSALQDLDVKTRWIVYHAASIPEARQATDYKGFRSIFLTDRYAVFLNALGLDFNCVIASYAADSLKSPQRRRWLFDLLNEPSGSGNELVESLIPQMRMLNRNSNRTFLLFHTRWMMGSMDTAPWLSNFGDQDRSKVRAAIHARDYRYLPDEEWYAQERRDQLTAQMDSVGNIIRDFLFQVQKEKLLDNTMLIITADHGEMASRGRFWYGYHPEEEVIRVPAVVFLAGKRGVDYRNLETADLVRTLTEYFGGSDFSDKNAISFLEASEKDFTSTITLRSDIHREWFLIVYRKNWKYVFNLHPASEGNSTKFSLTHSNFKSEPVSSGPEIIQEVLPQLSEALKQMGLPAGQIHPIYAKLAQ